MFALWKSLLFEPKWKVQLICIVHLIALAKNEERQYKTGGETFLRMRIRYSSCNYDFIISVDIYSVAAVELPCLIWRFYWRRSKTFR